MYLLKGGVTAGGLVLGCVSCHGWGLSGGVGGGVGRGCGVHWGDEVGWV